MYKRQGQTRLDGSALAQAYSHTGGETPDADPAVLKKFFEAFTCLLYTSDAADERSSVDLGGRRIIKKNKI